MTIKQVQQILKREGPATAQYVRARLEVTQSTVNRQVNWLKEKGLVHIVRWEHPPTSENGPRAAVYAYGPGKNVERPPWERKSEARFRSARTRLRNKQRTLEVKHVEYTLPPPGIWGGLMR